MYSSLLLRHPIGTTAVWRVHLNLAYRWFCKLHWTNPVTIRPPFESRRRHFRENPNCSRAFSWHVLSRCIAEEAGQWRSVRVDPSLIKADAHTKTVLSKRLVVVRTCIGHSEYLDTLDDPLSHTHRSPKYISPSDPAPVGRSGIAHISLLRRFSRRFFDHTIIIRIWSQFLSGRPNKACRDMIERTIDRFDLYPAQIGSRHRLRHGRSIARPSTRSTGASRSWMVRPTRWHVLTQRLPATIMRMMSSVAARR